MPRVATKLAPAARGGFIARKVIPSDVKDDYARLYGQATEERLSKHRMTDFERAERRADIADSIGDGPGRSLPAGKINAIIARELAQARAAGAVLYIPEQPHKRRPRS